MESKLEKTYLELSKLKKQRIIVTITSIFVLTLVVSIFLGMPVPYKESNILFTRWHMGWIIEKVYVWIAVCFISVIIAMAWETKGTMQIIKSYKDLLYKECDALALLQIAKYAISYIPNHVYNNEKEAIQVKNRLQMFYERLYVEALNAKGDYQKALDYLETEWKSKKDIYLAITKY